MSPNAHGPTLISAQHDTDFSGSERYKYFVFSSLRITQPTLPKGGAIRKMFLPNLVTKNQKTVVGSKKGFKRSLKHKKVKNKNENLVKLFSNSTFLSFLGLNLPHVARFKKFKPVDHIIRETLARPPSIITVNKIHDESKVFNVSTDKVTGELFFTLNINGTLVKFLIDTGSPVSLMSHKQYKECFPHNNVRKIKNKITLSAYTGHPVSTSFSIEPLMELPGYGELKQRFIITDKELGNIVGRDICNKQKPK